MSLLFMDSFKNYTFLPLKWDVVTKDCQFSIVDGIGRKGGRALRAYSGHTNFGDDYLARYLDTPQEELIAGFAFKKVKDDYGYLELSFDDASTSQSKVRLFNNNLLWYLGDETSQYGVNSSLKFNDWNYVEVKVKTHNVSGTLDIRVNETSVLSLTNIPTATTANNYIDALSWTARRITQTNEDYAYIEDLYVANTSGTVNNGFLGNCEIVTLSPSSDGTYSQFLPSPTYSGAANYELVDEPYHLEDTTTYSGTFLEFGSADDGIYEGQSSNFDNTSATTNGLLLSDYEQAMWFRFSGVNIPKDAKIISAKLQLYVEYRYTGSSYTHTAYAYLQKSTTPPAQITSISDFNARPKTNTKTSFEFYLVDPITLDFNEHLQELVSMDGWQEEDNAVLFQFHLNKVGTSSTTSYDRYRVRTYDYRSDPYHSDSPKLYVEWQLPGGDRDEYVVSENLNTMDTYKMATASGLDNIKAVGKDIFAIRELDRSSTADMHLVPATIVSGVTYSGTPFMPNDMSYKCYSFIEEVNPATSYAWTYDGLSLSEFGFTTYSG